MAEGEETFADTVDGNVSPSENESVPDGTVPPATDTGPVVEGTDGSGADPVPPATVPQADSGNGVATANETVQVDTEAVIAGGGSAENAAASAPQDSGPGIIAAWLQDGTAEGEDGDTAHAENGTQLLPPCTYEGQKDCEVWVILRKDASAAGQEILCRGPQQETVTLTKAEFPSELFASAVASGRVSFGESFDAAAVTAAMADPSVETWMGSFSLAFDQEPGSYTVEIRENREEGTEMSTLSVPLEYLAAACYEFDFDAVSFGSMSHGMLRTMEGDAEFGTSDRPTVRNIGNVPLRLSLWQDDMRMGKSAHGEWWVRYGVRLGDRGSFVRYYPEEETILSEIIGSGSSVPLTFSIETFWGNTGSYHGQITLQCVPATER
jgi:hypothetical protein